MTSYRYQAVGPDGAVHFGALEAESREQVVATLRAAGQTPMRVDLTRRPSWAWLHRPISWRRSLPMRDVVALTQALAPLLRAGLTLDRALAVLDSLMDRVAVRSLLKSLATRVRQGSTFADALAPTRAFPPYYIAMVRAGEMGGALADVISRLAQFLERSERIRERVKSSLIYPALLAAMIVVTLVVLVTLVLPRFEQMFAESHATLPLVTRIVMAIGRFITNFGWLLAIAGVFVGVALKLKLRRPAARLAWDDFVLRSRWTFHLPASIQTARFLRTLGTLITCGVTTSDALRIAREVLTNHALRQSADRLAQCVREGQGLSALLARDGRFPKVAAQLTRVGEETGRLDSMLLESADILDRETELATERLLALLVPVLTLGMGLLVAGLIASVLVGLLSINDLAL